jgi:uncharacterized protein YciI
MFVVLTTYTAPLEEIDYALPDHREWLTRHYTAGHFLCSGWRKPRDGDVIITSPMPRERIIAILATDPFVERHLARHEVIEFEATRTCPAMFAYNEALPA